MRVLCGQCGRVNTIRDDFDEPTVICSQCGRAIPVVRIGDGGPQAQGQAPGDGPPAPADEPHEMGFAEQARQSSGLKISVTCSHCGRTVKVSARVAGMKARCKGCNHSIDIPFPDDLDEFELPARHGGGQEHETGLELVAPVDHDEEAPPSFGPELVPVLEAIPQPDLAPAPSPHDPAAELAALDKELHLGDLVAVPAGDAGELASALEDFQGERNGVKQKAARSGKSRALRFSLLLLVGGAAIILPLAAMLPSLMTGDPPRDDTGLTDGGRVGGVTPPPVSPPTTRKTATQPGTQPATGPASPPKPVKPRCRILAASPAAFLDGGYFPAAPESVYWTITADVSAGKEPLRFKAQGSDVMLVFGEERFASLGLADGGGGVFPDRGRQAAISLEPRQARRISLLFQTPTGRNRGQLFIRGAIFEDIVLPARQDPIAPEKLAGRYVESPPRNLRPMLRHPVMAAIQAAVPQEVVLAPEPEGLRLTIPAAGVGGMAAPIGPGLFDLPLRRGDDVLAARARFVEGGRRMILYLADEPFHQLTYINPKVKAPPKPKPPPPATKPAEPETPDTQPVPAPPKPFNPYSKDPNERIKLPTGPSIFD